MVGGWREGRRIERLESGGQWGPDGGRLERGESGREAREKGPAGNRLERRSRMVGG